MSMEGHGWNCHPRSSYNECLNIPVSCEDDLSPSYFLPISTTLKTHRIHPTIVEDLLTNVLSDFT